MAVLQTLGTALGQLWNWPVSVLSEFTQKSEQLSWVQSSVVRSSPSSGPYRHCHHCHTSTASGEGNQMAVVKGASRTCWNETLTYIWRHGEPCSSAKRETW